MITVRTAIDAGDFEQAADLASQGLIQEQSTQQTDGSADEWRVLTAEIHLRRGDAADCLDELELLPAKPAATSSSSLVTLGQLALEMGSVSVAEAAFSHAYQADSTESAAYLNLGYLLGFEGRCWEAAPFHRAAIQNKQFTLHHLILLGASDPVIDDPTLRDRCLAAFPSDLLPRLGAARTAARLDQDSDAAAILKQIFVKDPANAEAQGLQGRIAERAGDDAIAEWESQLPASVTHHPEIWVARGLAARRQGQLPAAVRCFWEATQRDSNHRLAHFQLGQTLTSLHRSSEAKPYLDRAAALQRLAECVDEVFRYPTDTSRMQTASQLTKKLGRDWEAWAWADWARQTNPQCEWAATTIAALEGTLSSAPVALNSSEPPASRSDFSTEPLPTFVRVSGQLRAPLLATSGQKPIHFRDRAEESGLSFTYHPRGRNDSSEMRMFETTGGGVAVLDFDNDSFPDLYFTQAGSLDRAQQQPEWSDRCFRNRGDQHWQDITQSAGLLEADYGQGVTAGDFNNDGFDDLYIAHLGRNKLYTNQGDGTFLEATASVDQPGNRWTTSCLIADLNADGAPDLYDVNYLSREDATRAICRTGEELQWCNPSSFEAEQDQLFLNNGAGEFHDVTTTCGIVQPQGKGMGIIAADFDGSSRLSLFIANDAVPNFFFENQTASTGESPQFVETAMLKGLAVDAQGLPQACMGVAAGDMNGDQLLDMYVTNFYEQANTLYLQRPGGTFEDDTRRAKLHAPSWLNLGFGTQCIDADQDGHLDLVVTNGHVLDLSLKGTPFRMRPQFYRNQGPGAFEEINARDLGPYFEKEYLGRGLARLDWNRDGRNDFVVSNISAPASLVTNSTPETGNMVAIRLVGVQNARVPVGATISLHSGSLAWTQQLTAGDGYQCRNESRLVFGLGPAKRVDRWTVRWPSGLTQEFPGTDANCELTAVEGRAEPLKSPGFPVTPKRVIVP